MRPTKTRATRKRRRQSLLALTAVLALAGCSSDPAKTSPTSDPTSATSSATSESPVTATTESPVTADPTVADPPSAANPTTSADPAVADPTTNSPATDSPATAVPTVADPTTADPTTADPATESPATAADAGDGGDPCRLLTAAEAEAWLGQPVAAPLPSTFDIPPTGPGYDCSYSAVDESAGPTTVHVAVLASDLPRDLWEQAERAEDVEEVSGVGELAFFDKYDYKLDAFDHGRWIQAQLINTSESTLLADLSQIVINAIARI
jgi:hypothetical protein